MMQRPSSTKKKIIPGSRGVSSIGGRPTSGRSSSLTRLSSLQGRFSEGGRTQVKDSRPVTDKAYLSECADRILKFMSSTEYNATHLSARSLMNPSIKDFFGMFEFLYQLFRGPFKLLGKPEDEIPKLVKELRYPFTIKRGMLIGLGNRQSWGCLLGLIVWMIELVELHYSGSNNFTYMDDRAGDEFEGPGFNELLLEGVAESYKNYLQTGETDEEKDLEMFRNCVQMFIGPSRIEELQLEYQRLTEIQEELEIRKNEMSAKEDFILKSQMDIEKMNRYFMQMDQYLAEHRKKCAQDAEEIKRIEKEMEPLRCERERLHAILSQQAAEANQYRLLKTKLSAADGRLKTAMAQFLSLENAITDKEVKTCNTWESIQKMIKQREAIHRETKMVVKEFDDELASTMSSHLIRIPSELNPSVFLNDVDHIVAKTQVLLPLLQDKAAEAIKSEVNAQGALNELNEYLKELKQEESRCNALISAEKLKEKKKEEEYSESLKEIEETKTKAQLQANQNLSNQTKITEKKKKDIQSLEAGLAQLKIKVQGYEKECNLVLEKAYERYKSHEQEYSGSQREFMKKVRSELVDLN